MAELVVKRYATALFDVATIENKVNQYEEEVRVILKALEEKGVNIEKAGDEYLDRYQDKNKISAYAKAAVSFLTKHGIVTGSGGNVNPLNLATRAEIAVILQKIGT